MNKVSKIMSTETFAIIFSFVVGAGIIAIARPLCKGDNCTKKQAPPVKDWNNAVYRIGNACYEYKATPIECPSEGSQEIYESFLLQEQEVLKLKLHSLKQAQRQSDLEKAV
jgi:hypothetical protein